MRKVVFVTAALAIAGAATGVVPMADALSWAERTVADVLGLGTPAAPEKQIQHLVDRASSWRKQAEELEVKGVACALKADDLEKRVAEVRETIRGFVATARGAEDVSRVSFAFRGRSYLAADARRQTERWCSDEKRLVDDVAAERGKAERYADAAKTMRRSADTIEDARNRLADKMDGVRRDEELAKVEAEVADALRAVAGFDGGEIGAAIAAVEDRIRESRARARVASTGDGSLVGLEEALADVQRAAFDEEATKLAASYWPEP